MLRPAGGVAQAGARAGLLLAATAGFLALFPAGPAAASGPAVYTLSFQDVTGFSAPAGSLHPGDEVRWTNQSPETVRISSVSTNWSFSILVASGATTVPETVGAAGTYSYAGLDASPLSPYRASLTVTGTSSPSPSPSPTAGSGSSPAPSAPPSTGAAKPASSRPAARSSGGHAVAPASASAAAGGGPAFDPAALAPFDAGSLPGLPPSVAGAAPAVPGPRVAGPAAPSAAGAPATLSGPGTPSSLGSRALGTLVPARGRGLPIAVAALLGLGVLAGVVRVALGTAARSTP